MAAALSTTSAEFDDILRPDISLASAIPTIEAPDSPLAVDQPAGPSLASTLKLPESPTQYLSPTPTQHAFSVSDFSELFDESGGVEGDSAPADITVAANGSFIETSSGAVARKLKRFYDQRAGVGPTVRSPYTITGFVSQHGKPMYRVGHRDEVSAPAAVAADVEDRITQSKTPSETSSPQAKRRSRLSMHFLPPAMFTKSNVALTSRPPTASSSAPSTSKKLRKTRSIPDMFGTDGVVTTAPTFPVTGRGHSQSVTAMDIPRPRVTFDAVAHERQIDFFGELMEWFTPSSSASSNFSTHSLFNPGKVTTETEKPRAIISQPFGHGITFNVPSQKFPVNRLPTPRQLREMQSFESGLTARQEDPRIDFPDNDSPILSDASESDYEISRPPSAIRLSSLTLSAEDLTVDPVPGHEASDLTPSAESLRLSSHYSTEVFNVLQTYRGLPLFEKLVPESEDTTVFKLSLAADQSAAPRDDPRFVLWGETLPDRDMEDVSSASRDSLTENSTSNPSLSSISRRRSSKVSRLRSPEASVSQLPVVGQKILLAATIERWIAQLTSDLNYDELLNFFLTYRTYISGVDLCHLLISRFHWALQKPSSRQDETVRRIVRVRTFVAIRYWLLTFFTVDFMPNRELRLLIADWLNTLIHDPVLKKHVDGIDIVCRLVKVAKECKRAHTRAAEKPKTTLLTKATPESSLNAPPLDHVLGKSFAEAIRKPRLEDEESDLDLDFLPGEAKSEELTTGFPSDPANAHLTVGRAGGSTVLSPSRPTSLPLSSLNILQRTDHAPGPSTDTDLPFVQHTDAVPLPVRHSVLSRAFVKTIGRLGRWKRVLHPRTSIRSTPIGPCGAGASAFDIEISASRDLLTMNGGVEQYLKMIEPPVPKTIPPAINAVSVSPPPSALAAHPLIPPVPSTPPPLPYTSAPQSLTSPLPSTSNINSTPLTPVSKYESLPPTLPSPVPSDAVSFIPDDPPPTFAESEIASGALLPQPSSRRQVSQGSFSSYLDEGNESDRAQSFRSSSTDSFGAPLTSDGPLPPTFPGQHNQWQFDVVSIDDLDYSDTSSIPGEDLTHPPGLRRPLRKLPMRRDFEFVRRSEVSSMGIVSHESMRDSVSSSIHSDASPSSSGPRPIQKWHMKSIRKTFDTTSDNEDNGDVEAALKRLEGQISPKIQQEKVQKIDRWLDELNNGPPTSIDADDDSIFSREDIDIFDFDTPASHSDTQTLPDITVPNSEGDDSYQEEIHETHTPIPTQTSHNLPPPPGLEPASSSQPLLETKPVAEDVLPLEILQSRISSLDSPETTVVNPSIETVLSSKFAGPDTPRMHRSFILNFQAEQLAEHFSMIDRELFMGIKFEELVIDEWDECEEINILDWAQYLKDRARWRVEGRFADKTTALAAVRARFNLMVSFVVAEIVLTPPSERDIVVSKFIRIAWKSYSLSNFNTLTAIITALQNEWVSKAMRRNGWSRLSIHENRMFRDLKHFTAVADDFKFMRQVIDSIVDAKPVEGSAHASSVVSGGTDSQNGKGKASSDNRSIRPTTCIPFFGIYLSQLHRLNKLPALIDPTAPNSVIGIDPITANFDPPAHPEVFSALAPLPASMHLEPLINVHKQRRIADVIKSLVAGQHLASRVQFEIDKKLFQKCLRLRGLEPAYLQRALAMYPD